MCKHSHLLACDHPHLSPIAVRPTKVDWSGLSILAQVRLTQIVWLSKSTHNVEYASNIIVIVWSWSNALVLDYPWNEKENQRQNKYRDVCNLLDILYIQAFVYKVQFFISEISRFVFGESSLDSLQGEVRGVLMGLLWSISHLWRIELI